MSNRAQTFSARIDWSDLDLLGHVNNIAFSRFFQAARVEYCGHIGMNVYLGMKTGPILAASRVQFTAQLFYPGEVRVFTRVKKAGRTSVVLEHALLDAHGTLAAFGEDAARDQRSPVSLSHQPAMSLRRMCFARSFGSG